MEMIQIEAASLKRGKERVKLRVLNFGEVKSWQALKTLTSPPAVQEASGDPAAGNGNSKLVPSVSVEAGDCPPSAKPLAGTKRERSRSGQGE